MDWVFVFTQYFQYLPLPVTLKFDRHCKLFAQGKGRLKTTYAPLSKKGNTVFSLAYRQKTYPLRSGCNRWPWSSFSPLGEKPSRSWRLRPNIRYTVETDSV